jgi:hypothetical protein
MEAILGLSLYSYPYLNQQKCFVFLTIDYILSSTKLEIRENSFCLEMRGWGRGTGRG